MDNERVAITVCGDGGTGMFGGLGGISRIGRKEGYQVNNKYLGKSSISLRLVRSKWTHE